VGSPIYSTGIGLLLRGLNDVREIPPVAPPPVSTGGNKLPDSNATQSDIWGWVQKAASGIKGWIETEPDIDFDKKKSVN
jgi:hypothetical protein